MTEIVKIHWRYVTITEEEEGPLISTATHQHQGAIKMF